MLLILEPWPCLSSLSPLSSVLTMREEEGQAAGLGGEVGVSCFPTVLPNAELRNLPVKQAENHSAPPEVQGAGAPWPFLLPVLQPRCLVLGAAAAGRSSRCACQPNSSLGCLVKPWESGLSSLFIGYK